MIDKNKLKVKLQKTPRKDLLYLTVNPVDPKSIQTVLKQMEMFIGKDYVEILIIKD